MESTENSKAGRWAGIIMHWMVVLFMLFDGVIKFIKPEPVIRTTIGELGYKDHHIIVHGLSALLPLILFVIPRTRILGAVLLTAHLGGAVASHLRIDSPLFSHTFFPVYVGILMWGSVWLRNEGFRHLFPFVRSKR
ncbi:DoxX family protein [Pedobacter deserti]|uniref:DoxX family protein n=1 Tax=Pedobacter deserti TaxID=2817382 RepID=UPI00210C4C91|nr:DoxX family protein [Pedobacter sp. SYSU D00382]